MTIRDEDVNRIAGGDGEVRTSQGDKIGKIGQLYLDDESGRPSWVTVKTGLFGTQESFVPLSRAEVSGMDVVVPYDKETIKGAPRVDTEGSLSPQEEKRLYSYYMDVDTLRTRDDQDDSAGANTGIASRLTGHDRDNDGDRDRDRHEDEDRDRGGFNEDRQREHRSEQDQSEEEVGTSRLRRYVVTEKVVPVSREELPVKDSDPR